MKEMARALFGVFCLIFGALASDVNATNSSSMDSELGTDDIMQLSGVARELYETLNQKWDDLDKSEVMDIALKITYPQSCKTSSKCTEIPSMIFLKYGGKGLNILIGDHVPTIEECYEDATTEHLHKKSFSIDKLDQIIFMLDGFSMIPVPFDKGSVAEAMFKQLIKNR